MSISTIQIQFNTRTVESRASWNFQDGRAHLPTVSDSAQSAETACGYRPYRPYARIACICMGPCQIAQMRILKICVTIVWILTHAVHLPECGHLCGGKYGCHHPVISLVFLQGNHPDDDGGIFRQNIGSFGCGLAIQIFYTFLSCVSIFVQRRKFVCLFSLSMSSTVDLPYQSDSWAGANCQTVDGNFLMAWLRKSVKFVLRFMNDNGFRR